MADLKALRVVYKQVEGQEIDAVITNIDAENRRLSLSIKDIEPSAWDKFVDEHKPGDIVTGKITRFANFGAFVELADGLEGLCHISELSDERVDKPEDVVKLGQEMALACRIRIELTLSQDKLDVEIEVFRM